MKKIFYLVIILAAGIISSCSKDKKPTTGGGGTGPSKDGTTLQLMQDSIYLYAKEDYLWFDQLPSYGTVNPRSFTASDPFTAMQNEMDAISQYAINPSTNKPYEYYAPHPGIAKYSFIDDGTEGGALNGTKGDFGFDYNYNLVDDIRVVYVYPGSPADVAGLKRGYEITSINDDSDISYDGLFSDGTKSGTGTSAHNNYVYNSIFNSGTIKLTLKKPDGTSFTVSFATTNYTVNPVLKETVLDLGNGKKLGYLVFNSFTSDANADPKLDAAFQDFANQGITELAVDLRYNGGGFVSTAEYIDNYIVPPSKTGTLMYTYFYNSNLQNDIYPLLSKKYNISKGDFKPVNNQVGFVKKGSLNLSRVFFIITGGTASASELTINNLRPEMDVELVGETSYGKPVGFFNIDFGQYTMYTPEFSTKNSSNQGDYYAGMTPNANGYNGVNDLDDYTKDFGDPTEGLLAHIVNKVKLGTFDIPGKVIQSLSSNPKAFSLAMSRDKSMALNKNKFTGMVNNKKLKHRR